MESRAMTTNEQRMTSLDIAAVTGKLHKNVLKAIREMEPAWEKECGLKFELTSERIKMPQGGVRLIPVFMLTKTESLYVATKFNDEARARLVKRWYELECQQTRAERPTQKLLVTERELMSQVDALRREQIGEENAAADGCLTTSEVARLMETTAKALYKALVAERVLFWNGGRYKLTPKYEDCGLAQERAFHYYSLEGEKKERNYLVWTPIGAEMIRTII